MEIKNYPIRSAYSVSLLGQLIWSAYLVSLLGQLTPARLLGQLIWLAFTFLLKLAFKLKNIPVKTLQKRSVLKIF